MAKDADAESGKVGIIPDFFHDIIAYIIPGFTALGAFGCNLYIIGLTKMPFIKGIDVKGFSLSLLVAYVVGRFLEQLGYMTIHRRRFPFMGAAAKVPSPKWSLIFDPKDDHYTNPFKDNVTQKIKKWLERQDGSSLIEVCRSTRRDDYFNLIQFYLRERFPSVSLYEKKQNATIVLMRSLAIAFFGNVLIYPILLTLSKETLVPSLKAAYWLCLNLLFSGVFYVRFQQDKIYHAMYIFETFIAMKKLLGSKGAGEGDDA